MGPVSGLVLYAIIWFMTFFVAIPIRLQTQGEAGSTVPGTHHGSPERHDLKKKAWITTAVAFVIWAVVAWVILSGAISLDDIDLFSRFGPGPVEGRGLGG
jgi:predicted secreted protein